MAATISDFYAVARAPAGDSKELATSEDIRRVEERLLKNMDIKLTDFKCELIKLATIGVMILQAFLVIGILASSTAKLSA